MRCERMDAIEFLRSDLTPLEVRRCLAHVDSCSECRRRLSIAVALRATAIDTRTRLLRWWPVAAALVLTVLLAVQRPAADLGSTDPATLATSARYPLIQLVTRSRQVAASEAALRAYQAGDCSRLLDLAGSSPPNGDLQFAAGVCLYLAGDLATAREQFESGLALSRSWSEPTAWYLANLELKANRPGQARARLQRLTASEGEYRQRARELLRQLGDPP